MTLSLANHHASLPVAYRLYLPKEWVTDRTRRRKAGVPKEITFKTKPAIAVDHLRWACAAGLAARRGIDGRRLWRRHCSAWEYHRTWPELCGRHPTTNLGMGAWNWAAAAEEMVRERATSKVAAA